MASLKLWSESFMIWSDSFWPQRKEWHFFTLEAGLHSFFRTSTGCVLNKVFPNWGSSCRIQAVQDFTHTRGHLLTSMPRPSGCFCLISLWCSYTANLSSSSFPVCRRCIPGNPLHSSALYTQLAPLIVDIESCRLCPLPEISAFTKQRFSNRKRETETWPFPKKFTQNGDKLTSLNSWRK